MTPFGTMPDGGEVHRLHLENDHLTVGVLTLGATLQSVQLQDSTHNLTLGFDRLETYLEAGHFAGGIVGPIANRIANARGHLNGQTYQFDANDESNTLHSGHASWHIKLWDVVDRGVDFITLGLSTRAGEGGFPADTNIRATYQLKGKSLSLAVVVCTNADTWIAPTHHSYWNLDGAQTIDAHLLKIAADHYLCTDESRLPISAAPTQGTPFDFREPTQIKGHSLDHNFCLSNTRQGLRHVAQLSAPSGPVLDIATTDVGLQVYDGAGLDIDGHGPRSFVALEPQGWPNAMNRADFPPVTLHAGKVFHQITRWTLHAQ